MLKKTENVQVTAVRERDLYGVLARFGLSDQLDEGLLDCESCSIVLTWHNIGAMVVRNKRLVVYCDLAECIEEATKNRK